MNPETDLACRRHCYKCCPLHGAAQEQACQSQWHQWARADRNKNWLGMAGVPAEPEKGATGDEGKTLTK